jgi:hypothetical protein
MILTRVGASRELVDDDLFLDIHEQLADHFRSQGLTGHDLDVAIVGAMPDALQQALHGDRGSVH